jgi:hypothetical protein
MTSPTWNLLQLNWQESKRVQCLYHHQGNNCFNYRTIRSTVPPLLPLGSRSFYVNRVLTSTYSLNFGAFGYQTDWDWNWSHFSIIGTCSAYLNECLYMVRVNELLSRYMDIGDASKIPTGQFCAQYWASSGVLGLSCCAKQGGLRECWAAGRLS